MRCFISWKLLPSRGDKYLHTMHKVHCCRRWENRLNETCLSTFVAFLILSINFYYCKHHHCLLGAVAVASIRKHLIDTFFQQIPLCHFNDHRNYTAHILMSKWEREKKAAQVQWQSLINFAMMRDCFWWKMQIFVYENKYCTSFCDVYMQVEANLLTFHIEHLAFMNRLFFLSRLFSNFPCFFRTLVEAVMMIVGTERAWRF